MEHVWYSGPSLRTLLFKSWPERRVKYWRGLCLGQRWSVSVHTITTFIPSSVFAARLMQPICLLMHLLMGGTEFPPKQYTCSPTPSLAGMTQYSQNLKNLYWWDLTFGWLPFCLKFVLKLLCSWRWTVLKARGLYWWLSRAPKWKDLHRSCVFCILVFYYLSTVAGFIKEPALLYVFLNTRCFKITNFQRW